MEKFLYLAETEVNAAIIITNILFVFFLELIIAATYRHTHRTLSYSQSFVFTMILMGLISAVIMMVVTENIVGAFALLGAFSLIRFRTIVKETRDISFVFFSLAVGVAGGTNNYTVALISTLLICGIIVVLNRFNFGTAAKGGHLLLLTAKAPYNPESAHNWQDYVKTYSVLHVKTLTDIVREYTISISLKDPKTVSTLVDKVKQNANVESVELISGKDAVEY